MTSSPGLLGQHVMAGPAAAMTGRCGIGPRHPADDFISAQQLCARKTLKVSTFNLIGDWLAGSWMSTRRGPIKAQSNKGRMKRDQDAFREVCERREPRVVSYSSWTIRVLPQHPVVRARHR